jgi:cytoskeletal protein RodZ
MALNFKKSRRNFTLALAVLVLVIAAYIYAQHRSRISNPVIPSTNPAAAKSSSSQSSSGQQAAPNNSSPATSTSEKAPAATPSTGSGSLIEPYGDFISNHHPGGSAPTTEASVCNTTAGAVCYIQFTMGSTVKKLTAQTTGSNGATYWYWDVKDAGLSQGSWTVTAIASLNGQTKSAADSQPLLVQ